MIRLAPEWSLYYDEFWESITRRNSHFIKLRFIAILGLLIVKFYSDLLFDFNLTEIQVCVFECVITTMLIYNFLFIYLKKRVKNKPKTFNPLYLSFFQIIADLITLSVLIYFTGTIESPFIWFSTFHMIVGSLLLPELIIYLLSSVFILTFLFLVSGEFHGVIPHHHIVGLFGSELYNSFSYTVIISFTFTLLIIFTVYLTNRIARELYKQQGDLLTAMDELAKTDEKKHKYLLGVVHEIKSPIVASHSLLELIIKGYLGEVNPQIMEKLLRIENRNNEIIERVNSILRISRFHQLDESDLQKIDLNDFLHNLAERFTDFAHSKQIQLSVQEFKSFEINGEKELLELVISNLLSNSIKYTENNGNVQISVQQDGNFAVIKVCDDGIGIEGDDKNKVFQPYFRCKHKSKTEGLGIGLYLVKEIVVQHNGEIVVDSPSPLAKENFPGSCFSVKLPINPHQIDKKNKINEQILKQRS